MLTRAKKNIQPPLRFREIKGAEKIVLRGPGRPPKNINRGRPKGTTLGKRLNPEEI
jgi:hypothetical protein